MAMPNQRRFWGTGMLTAVLLLGTATGTALMRDARAQDTPAIEVVSPQPGETMTSDDIDVQVEVSDFTVDCAKAGRPNEEGVGHIHVMIDGMSMAQLANFYCGDSFTVPGDGLTPGEHTLIIDLATNDHLDMMETAQEVAFTYEPANPVPLPEAEDMGTPGVELVSPTEGATVPSKFTIEVEPVNFEVSEELEGKQNVPGYGHWHVFVDTPMGEMMMEEEDMEGTPEAAGETDEMHMMAMGGMILMPGTNSFEVDLSEWGPGEHTIFVEPVQNDHTNFAEFEHVEFTVTVEPAA
ncbi:MAG: hypothetical protein ACRDJC_02905 [Thermomicrobiales bacterium]